MAILLLMNLECKKKWGGVEVVGGGWRGGEKIQINCASLCEKRKLLVQGELWLEPVQDLMKDP